MEVVEDKQDRGSAGAGHQEPGDTVEEAVPFILRRDWGRAAVGRHPAGGRGRPGRQPPVTSGSDGSAVHSMSEPSYTATSSIPINPSANATDDAATPPPQ